VPAVMVSQQLLRRAAARCAGAAAGPIGLCAHRFKLGDIERAYALFSNQRDGVLKVAITP
jgi:alcohol dehydrogenase